MLLGVVHSWKYCPSIKDHWDCSLKDILYMEDCGASCVTDFTYFGFPSTYMLKEEELLEIFDKTDLNIGNNSRNYWVVEFADGILQRETALLLQSCNVKSRIHKLIFAAHDGMGAIGGIRILNDKFDLSPDGIVGSLFKLTACITRTKRILKQTNF